MGKKLVITRSIPNGHGIQINFLPMWYCIQKPKWETKTLWKAKSKVTFELLLFTFMLINPHEKRFLVYHVWRNHFFPLFNEVTENITLYLVNWWISVVSYSIFIDIHSDFIDYHQAFSNDHLTKMDYSFVMYDVLQEIGPCFMKGWIRSGSFYTFLCSWQHISNDTMLQ